MEPILSEYDYTISYFSWSILYIIILYYYNAAFIEYQLFLGGWGCFGKTRFCGWLNCPPTWGGPNEPGIGSCIPPIPIGGIAPTWGMGIIWFGAPVGAHGILNCGFIPYNGCGIMLGTKLFVFTDINCFFLLSLNCLFYSAFIKIVIKGFPRKRAVTLGTSKYVAKAILKSFLKLWKIY